MDPFPRTPAAVPDGDEPTVGHEPTAGGGTSLARFWLLIAAVALLFLATFVLATLVGVPLLDDPTPVLGGAGVLAALCGIGLLVADVLLPVPSSVVMIAHGALFGAAVGAVLSVVGGVGAALAGYGLGRWAGPPRLRRVCSAGEQDRARRMVDRWGVLAVVVSRPVPLLAETVAVTAGAQRLGWGRTTAAAAAGILPTAVLYAAAGALGWTGAPGLIAFGLLVVVAAVVWWAVMWWAARARNGGS